MKGCDSQRKARTTESSPWEMTLWIGSALKQDFLLHDSIWPACADELWQHLTIRDVMSNYRLRFESPTRVRTVVPFSSLHGFVTFLQGSMLPGERKGLLSTGTFAWILQLDPKLRSVYRCGLRFYDRYVDHAEDFEWVEIDPSEQEKEATLIMQAPQSILREKLWPKGEAVLELLEAALQRGAFERLMNLEDEGMRQFFSEMGESHQVRLRKLFPQ